MERRLRAIQRIGDEVPVKRDDDFSEEWPLHRKPIGASTFILCLRANCRFRRAGILIAASLIGPVAMQIISCWAKAEVQFEK